MEAINNDFVKELNKRRSYRMCLVSLSFPQYMMKVDNDLAQQKEYLLRMQ
jgi:HAE1 family hydrophobic/amphiphilic exporter-1